MNTRLAPAVVLGLVVLAGCSGGSGAEVSSGSTSPAQQPTARTDAEASTQAPTTLAAMPTMTTVGSSASMAGSSDYDLSIPPTCVMRIAVELGSVGDDVRCLQTRLQQVTVTGEEIIIDGDFGPATERVVRAFQEAHGLIVDGIAGAETAGRLGVWGEDSPGTPTSASG